MPHPQATLEHALFGILSARGYGPTHVAVYQLVSRFLAARRPLVVLLVGAPWSGWSTHMRLFDVVCGGCGAGSMQGGVVGVCMCVHACVCAVAVYSCCHICICVKRVGWDTGEGMLRSAELELGASPCTPVYASMISPPSHCDAPHWCAPNNIRASVFPHSLSTPAPHTTTTTNLLDSLTATSSLWPPPTHLQANLPWPSSWRLASICPTSCPPRCCTSC